MSLFPFSTINRSTILHIFQNIKYLLCPKSLSLLNYSASLILKCKGVKHLLVLTISGQIKTLFVKVSYIFRNTCQVIYMFAQPVSFFLERHSHLHMYYVNIQIKNTLNSNNFVITVTFFY